MKAQLGDVDGEKQRLISAKDSIARELVYTKAELERYQRDNEDLSMQVCVWRKCLIPVF